jgi:hypothetical protein
MGMLELHAAWFEPCFDGSGVFWLKNHSAALYAAILSSRYS